MSDEERAVWYLAVYDAWLDAECRHDDYSELEFYDEWLDVLEYEGD